MFIFIRGGNCLYRTYIGLKGDCLGRAISFMMIDIYRRDPFIGSALEVLLEECLWAFLCLCIHTLVRDTTQFYASGPWS